MRLSAYLKDKKLDDDGFAAMVGVVSKHAVKKWRYGERVPPADMIARIEDVTAGEVSLRDWIAGSSIDQPPVAA